MRAVSRTLRALELEDHVTATLLCLKKQPLAAQLPKQVAASGQFQILKRAFVHTSLHAEDHDMLSGGWSQAVMQRDGMPGPAKAYQRWPTANQSSSDCEFMTCVDRRPSISSGVSGAPRQIAPIGSRSVEAGPRSRHPSEECVSQHGQAADTCLWPLRAGPDRWDNVFRGNPPITSAFERQVQWAQIGRMALCDAEVTNRRIEGDPGPLVATVSGPMVGDA